MTSSVNLAAAAEFLAALDPAGEWTFQTFADDSDRKRGALAKQFLGDLDRHGEALTRLNEQGAGVFVTVNETDGKGRKATNVVRVRAVFVDLDGSPLEPVQAGPLAPHIVVETSSERWHCYWRIADCPPTRFRQIQQALARRFGGDPSVCDLPRVMRLPGFYHRKGEPFMVRMIENHPGEYTTAEFVDAFGIKEPGPKPKRKPRPATGATTDDDPLLSEALAAIPPEDYHEWLSVGMALKDGGRSDGFDIWCNWSARSDKFPGAEALRRKWESFQSGGHGHGNIIESAKRHGWRPPTRSSAQPSEPPPMPPGYLDSLADPAAAPAEPDDTPAPSPPPPGDDPPGDAVCEYLNTRHAIVPYAGRVLVMTEGIDPTTGRKALHFSSASDLKLRYSNRFVTEEYETPRGTAIKKTDWGAVWLKHPDRRQYEGIVFDPEKTPRGYFNIWRGFSIEPAPGDCTLYTQHLREVICAGDPGKFRYLWLWLTHLVQRPWELPEVSVVMRGEQGCGKDSVIKPLGKIFGRHYVPLTQSGLLVGRFTAHLMEAVLVFANEAVWGGDKAGEGKLKAMITDGLETVEAKGKDALAFPNYKRIIAASNEDWAVPRGVGDRRFFCLDVSEHRMGDSAYFAALHGEIANGGAEALLYELLNQDLADWHPRHNMPADNSDGEDMKLRGMSSVLKFWVECLEFGANYHLAEDCPRCAGTGRVAHIDYENPACFACGGTGKNPSTSFGAWSTEVPRDEFYQRYVDWCSRHRVHHPDGIIQFRRELEKAVTIRVRRPARNAPRNFVFPDLAEARRQFKARIARIDFDGDDDPEDPEHAGDTDAETASPHRYNVA